MSTERIDQAQNASSSGAESLRILGVTQRQFGVKNGRFTGKGSDYFNILSERFNLVALEMVYESGFNKYMRMALSFHPSRKRWSQRYRTNYPLDFKLRTRRAESQIAHWEGQYDLIFQLHSMLAPGKQANRRPYVLTLDNTHLQRLRSWMAEAASPGQTRRWIELERGVYQNAQYVFAWSEDTRQSVIEEYGVDADRVVVATPGANFLATELTKQNYDSQTALFVGTDFIRKGGPTLLEAWESVHRQLPAARLLIVGPSTRPGTVPDGVEWIGRVNDRAELQQIFERSSCFVLPSVFEPWGNAMVEAMGLGIPAIGPDHLGPGDTNIDGETGYTVAPHQVQPLAERLLALLGDPALAERMGRAAYERVRKEYTWEAAIDRIVPYLMKAAGK